MTENILEFRGITPSGETYSLQMNLFPDAIPIDCVYLWEFIHEHNSFTTLDFKNYLRSIFTSDQRDITQKYVSEFLNNTSLEYESTDQGYRIYYSPVFPETEPDSLNASMVDLLRRVFLKGKTKREAKVALAQEDADLSTFETVFNSMVDNGELEQISIETDPVYKTTRPDGKYFSESKNDYVLIEDMALPHLINAIKKRYGQLTLSEVIDQMVEDNNELTDLLDDFFSRS